MTPHSLHFLSLSLLTIALVNSLQVPPLKTLFLQTKFSTTALPPAKLNDLIELTSTATSLSEQLAAIEAFSSNLGSAKVKKSYEKAASELKSNAELAMEIISKTEEAFLPLLGEGVQEFDARLSSIYQEGSLTKALPRFFIEIAKEAAKTNGKQKTKEVLGQLLEYEHSRSEDVKEMNEYFSE